MTPLDGDDWAFLALQGVILVLIVAAVVNVLLPRKGEPWRLSDRLLDAATLIVGGMVAYVCLAAAMGWNEG